MSIRELPKPPVASWPIWKTMLGGLSLSAIFVFLIWLFNSILHLYDTGVFSHPVTVGCILLGNFWLLFALWMRWTWQPRRKHGRWYRWLGNLIGGLYMFGLILSGAIAYWSALLNKPWNWLVISILIVLFIVAWILPALSSRWSKKSARAQDTVSLRMFSCGGTGGLMVLAGILGASFGMDASRNGELGSAIFVMAILFSLLAIFWTQYAAEHLWRYRPWQKEEE